MPKKNLLSNFIDKKLPAILDKKVVAKSNLFQIEQISLQFSNNEKRIYERLKPSKHQGVIIVPLTADNEIILVKEYAVGTEQYELGFVKGAVDHDELAELAANRELKEEIGFGAHQLTLLKEVVMSPAYFSHSAFLYLAQDLYVEALPGDEPEPLELIYWPLTRAEELLALDAFNEPRCIVALQMVLIKLGLLNWSPK